MICFNPVSDREANALGPSQLLTRANTPVAPLLYMPTATSEGWTVADSIVALPPGCPPPHYLTYHHLKIVLHMLPTGLQIPKTFFQLCTTTETPGGMVFLAGGHFQDKPCQHSKEVQRFLESPLACMGRLW